MFLRSLPASVVVLVLSAVTGITAVIVQPPANAHQGSSACAERNYSGVLRGVACNRYTSGDHNSNWVDGCDREADGWRVRAWGKVISLPEVSGDWDPNGTQSGCANMLLSAGHLERQKICVEVAGCGSYTNHGYP
jgi:hypothetical protein